MSSNFTYLALSVAVSIAAAVMDATLKSERKADQALSLSVGARSEPGRKLFFHPGTGFSIRSTVR